MESTGPMLECSICFGADNSARGVRVFRMCNLIGAAKFPSAGCRHKFCEDCLRYYIVLQLDVLNTRVRCPLPNCGYILFKSDIRYLARDEFEACMLRLREYAARPEETQLSRYTDAAHIVRCPGCLAGVERSEGCNHMTCLCGTHFCYGCGGRFMMGEYWHECSSICTRCSGFGHTVAKCKTPRCSKCYQYGHRSRQCDIGHAWRSEVCVVCGCYDYAHWGPGCPVVQCRVCGEYNHGARACPTAALCAICRCIGHTPRDCVAPLCSHTAMCTAAADHTPDTCEEVDRAGMATGHVPWPMLCEWFASDESEGDEREEEPSDDIPLVARDRRETTLRPSLGRADIDKLGKHPNKATKEEQRGPRPRPRRHGRTRKASESDGFADEYSTIKEIRSIRWTRRQEVNRAMQKTRQVDKQSRANGELRCIESTLGDSNAKP